METALNNSDGPIAALRRRGFIELGNESAQGMTRGRKQYCAALVVIPCLNEARHLRRLVSELVESNGADLHVAIVDGGSQDGTLEIARTLESEFPNVSVFENPKRFQSAGINLAVSRFPGQMEYIIRIDAHALYPPDYCRVLIAEAARTGAASVVVGMETIGEGWFQKAVADAQNSRLGNGGSAHRSAATQGMWTEHGHHALMQVDPFSRVGGYDETFSHNEDAELDVRLRQQGFRIWLTGLTGIKYYPRASVNGLFRQYANFGAGRARTIVKHRAMPRLRQLIPAAVVPLGLLALASPLWPTAAVPLLFWATTCLAYGLLLAVQRRSAHTVASGAAAMIMHAGFSLGFWSSMIKYGKVSVFSARK